MNATIDFQPTPEMQAVARSALARVKGATDVVSKPTLDRAKRIARGVPLSEDQVVEIHRENLRTLAGDITPDQELAHRLRGGSVGALWASERVAVLTAKQDEEQRLGPLVEVVRQGRELAGLSLVEARQRRSMELADANGGAASEGAREAVFSAAEALRQAARAVDSIRPDDGSEAVMARCATASQHCHAARGLLPKGHPCTADVESACTVVDSVRSYEAAEGVGKSIDNLADRVITLDPDFDGDNDFGSEESDEASEQGNVFDSDTEPNPQANFEDYLRYVDVELADGRRTVICHSCGARVHPTGRAETCPKCGAPVGESTGGGGDFSESGDPDLALYWSDQARIAAALAREGERHSSRPPVPFTTNPHHPEFHWHEHAAKYVSKAIWHANLAENPDLKEKTFHAGIAQKHISSALRLVPSGFIAERKLTHAKDWLAIESPKGTSENTTRVLREARHHMVGYAEDEEADLGLTWSDQAREAAALARRSREHPHTEGFDHLKATYEHAAAAGGHLRSALDSVPSDHPAAKSLQAAHGHVTEGMQHLHDTYAMSGHSENNTKADIELGWSDEARAASAAARKAKEHLHMPPDAIHVRRHLEGAHKAIDSAEGERDNHLKLIHNEMAGAHLLKASVSLPDDHPGFRKLTEAQHEVRRGLYGNARKRMDEVHAEVGEDRPDQSADEHDIAAGRSHVESALQHLDPENASGSRDEARRHVELASSYFPEGHDAVHHIRQAQDAMDKGNDWAGYKHLVNAHRA